jgi:two-component system LytT family response regulator
MKQIKEITVIVAEDEPAIRQKIISILAEVREIEVICAVENGIQLMEQCLIHEPDAVFADIGLPEMSGMEAIQNLLVDLPDLFTVFITAYSQYAVEAFEISAVDYVLKPITSKRILKAVAKLKQHLLEKEALRQQRNASNIKKEKIPVRDERGLIFLNQDDIFMLEKEQKKTIIHTKTQKYKTLATINSFKQKLNSSFFQTHRSFIINLDKVHKVIPFGDRTGMIEFENYKQKAQVSRNNLGELYRRLNLND